ncbi:MAG: Methyl-accepting chemotaxis protein [Candidatus Ozemobacter sibiricus]|uniref:Methyl-accepting chemotaxis protein n=1 Tax=Candidatus Ozemobacter sibiricus TaxID=2268124 RepID=A0A367ZSV0_9BACT|nr:MAG: Methyl-accepting chemotaxis protein [Candidatus Ozemobacter sibiricus]
MKLSISKKIMAGFFAILVICLAVVGVAGYLLNRLKTEIDFLQEAQLPILNKVQQWSSDVNTVGLTALQLAIQGKNDDLQKAYDDARDRAGANLAGIRDEINKRMATRGRPVLQVVEAGEAAMEELFSLCDGLLKKEVAPTPAQFAEAATSIREKLESLQGTAQSVGEYFKNTEGRRIENDLKSMFAVLGTVMKVLPVGVILFGIGFTWFISTGISGPLEKITQSMSEAERGMLETRIELATEDEFGRLAESFNRMLSGICQMIAKVITTSHDLATSSQQLSSASVQSAATLLDISKNVNEINASANEVSNNLEKTSNSVEAFAVSAQKVASLAETAVVAANTTSEAAAAGGKTVKKSVEMIGKIKESVDMATQVIVDLSSASMQINEIVNTITAIASQTNLLALNAAIEAARAGEQGKGFTVVADEVRKLAEESAEAAEAIGTRIENILTKTQNAVDSMQMGRSRVDEGIRIIREVSNGLDNIISNIENVNQKIKDISKISAEQSHGSMVMSRTIEDITKLTKQTSERTAVVATAVEQQTTTVSQISSSTEDLASLADELQSLVSRFTISKKGSGPSR